MCELFSIGVKNEPAIKFVTDFWDNPRMCLNLNGMSYAIVTLSLYAM
jgi:hypothetical protein